MVVSNIPRVLTWYYENTSRVLTGYFHGTADLAEHATLLRLLVAVFVVEHTAYGLFGMALSSTHRVLTLTAALVGSVSDIREFHDVSSRSCNEVSCSAW
jgi:hypothetical protein